MSRVSPVAPWATELDLPESCNNTAVRPNTVIAALNFATDVLYNLTKRRWPGIGTDTYRPLWGTDNCYHWRCAPDVLRRFGNYAGTQYGITGDSHSGLPMDYFMTDHDSVRLPASDVVSIDKVTVDGVPLAASEYGLRNSRSLYAKRQANGTVRSWPCYNDLSRPTTDVNTFEIVYSFGSNPPASMVLACALLGWEFSLAWTPDCAASCRLPKRITTVTRAGMTFGVVDPLTVFEKGMIGIPDIDVLIQAVNRGDKLQRAFVGRPGQPSRVSRE